MRAVSTIGADERELRIPERGGVLVFDGYCGFCTRAVHAVLRLDRRGRVRALPLQGPAVLELTALSREEALHQAWWIGADGRYVGGAGAMAAATSAATRAPLLRLYRLPGARQVADRAYRWVAGHRRLLRGVTPHCEAVPGAGCDADVGVSCGDRSPRLGPWRDASGTRTSPRSATAPGSTRSSASTWRCAAPGPGR